MFENIMKFFKKMGKSQPDTGKSKDAAKERLHLVLMQDRANVSADFLDLMKQEIIEVIKKYIDVDENAIDVRLTNKANADGTNGAPALYANIPIMSIKEDVKNGMARQGAQEEAKPNQKQDQAEENKVEPKQEEKKMEEPNKKQEKPIVEEKKENNQNQASNKENEIKQTEGE